MKTYSLNSSVRKPMMFGGNPNTGRKMQTTGMMSATPMPMGSGMMQDKRNKTLQGMMKKGGRVNKRSR